MELSVRKDAWIWPVVMAGHAAIFAWVLTIGMAVKKPLIVPAVNVALVVDESERVLESKRQDIPLPMPETKNPKAADQPLAKQAVKLTPVNSAPAVTSVAALKETKSEVPSLPFSSSLEKTDREDIPVSDAGKSSAVTGSDKPVTEAVDAKAAKVADANTASRKVSALAYLRAPQPLYPAASRRLNEQGTVVLKVMVDEAGRVMEVMVQTSSGFTRLDEAARRAVQAAVFRPYVENGHSMKAWANVPISFGLVEGGNHE